MKIKIEHIPNTYNYGSLMMAINTLIKLNKEVKDVELYVDTSTEKDFKRLSKESNISNLQRAHKMKGGSRLTKISRWIKRIKKERDLYDIKIVLGGDDISEYYGKLNWLIDFPLMKIEAKNIPTILLGQTIGPFTGYNRVLARKALNKIKIYTRDDKCFKYLNELGVKTALAGRDLAFLDLPNNKSKTGILQKYNIENEEYITIVPSGLTESYTNSFEIYLNEQVRIVEGILNNKRFNNKKIVLLPHVLLPKTVDDRIVVRKIVEKINLKLNDRIIAINDEMLASEAREILGNGLFTITGRMHAAVSTFYMRKPAISLSYSVKYAGVIGDGLDMNELVIECADEKLWNTGEISKLVDEKVNYVLDNYDELVKKINIKVSETSKIVEEELNDIVNQIKNIITN